MHAGVRFNLNKLVCLGCAPCKGGAFQWVRIPPGEMLQPEATGAVREVTNWLKPSVKRATNWLLRECAGRNASERRASLEKDDAQVDPPTLAGKTDTTGWMSTVGPPVAAPG
jgi:predicted Fe-S protein YdhL (DUF1289 family)